MGTFDAFGEFGHAVAASGVCFAFVIALSAIIAGLQNSREERRRRSRIEARRRTIRRRDIEERCPDWADPDLWRLSL